jgi:hypothetical protein
MGRTLHVVRVIAPLALAISLAACAPNPSYGNKLPAAGCYSTPTPGADWDMSFTGKIEPLNLEYVATTDGSCQGTALGHVTGVFAPTSTAANARCNAVLGGTHTGDDFNFGTEYPGLNDIWQCDDLTKG